MTRAFSISQWGVEFSLPASPFQSIPLFFLPRPFPFLLISHLGLINPTKSLCEGCKLRPQVRSKPSPGHQTPFGAAKASS